MTKKRLTIEEMKMMLEVIKIKNKEGYEKTSNYGKGFMAGKVHMLSFIIDNIRTVKDIQTTSTLIAADITSETDNNEFVK